MGQSFNQVTVKADGTLLFYTLIYVNQSLRMMTLDKRQLVLVQDTIQDQKIARSFMVGSMICPLHVEFRFFLYL